MPEPEPGTPVPTCTCGITVDTPTGWCGLSHHGIGCRTQSTCLTPMSPHPRSRRTVHVCIRCAARATWWQTHPRDRAPTHEGGILGRFLLLPDGTRTPIGTRPPHAHP